MSEHDGVLASVSTEDSLIAALDRIEIPGELLNPAELKELSSQVKYRLEAAKSAANRLKKSLKKEGWERFWDSVKGDQTKVLQEALKEIHHLAELETKMILVGLLLAKKHNQSTLRLQSQQNLLADQQDKLRSLQEKEAAVSQQIHSVVTDLAGVRSAMEAHREEISAHSVSIQSHSDQITAFCQQMTDYVKSKLETSERQAADFQRDITHDLTTRTEEWKTLRDAVATGIEQGCKDRRLALILAGTALIIAVVSLVLSIIR